MSTSYTTHSPNEHALGEIVEASVVPDTSQASTVHNGGTTSSEAVTVSVGESRNNNNSTGSIYARDEVIICRPKLRSTGKWYTASPKETMSLPEKVALVIVPLLLIILPIIAGTVKHVTGLLPSLIAAVVFLVVILIFLIFRNRKRIRLTFARLIHYLAARVPYHEIDDA